jgi:hypothetical protein
MAATVFPQLIRLATGLNQPLNTNGMTIETIANATAFPSVNDRGTGSLVTTRDNGAVYVLFDDGVTGKAWTRIYQGTDPLSVVVDMDAVITANATANRYIAFPGSNRAILRRIRAIAAVVPASAGGTITLAVGTGALFATNLLNAATVDLETGFTAGTVVNLGLTATTADLNQASGAAIRAQVVSNNADATGGPVRLQFEFELLPTV